MNPTLYSTLLLALAAAAPPAPDSQITAVAASEFDQVDNLEARGHDDDDDDDKDDRRNTRRYSWNSDRPWYEQTWLTQYKTKHKSWNSDLPWYEQTWLSQYATRLPPEVTAKTKTTATARPGTSDQGQAVPSANGARTSSASIATAIVAILSIL